MKKFLLSSLVIVVFTMYVLHDRSERSEAKVVIPSQPTLPPAESTPTSMPPTPEKAGPVEPTQATAQPTSIPTQKLGRYKDGEYTGNAADAIYGNIQVKAIIQGGNITDVQFLQYPNDRQTSIEINTQAMPYLKSEAIQAQSANVDIVTGATDSSIAFRESLASALGQASN